MSLADVILPLGPGTCSGNDELRIFLRSLEENGRNVGMVWLVTVCAPDWLVPGNGLTVLPFPDNHLHNKDANLFEKCTEAMKRSEAESVVFTADDCAVLQPCDFAALPPIFNHRTKKDFTKSKKWGRRMRMTLQELGLEGGNFDTHCPQRWPRVAALEAIAATPYLRRKGRCIDTAIMGRVYGGIPAEAVPQEDVKETVEKEEKAKAAKLDKLFVAYNDKEFLGGLREKLFERFPQPSKWEARA